MASEITSLEQLERMISEPSAGVIETLGRLDGDIIVLGAGGKMGPSLSWMAKRGSDEAGVRRRVIAVSRFSNAEEEGKLNEVGVETIRCDLMDRNALNALPDAPNVVFMVGMKFGSTGQAGLTWAMNSYLPGMVCEKYAKSRIVAFSSGNVYGLAPIARGGSVETDDVRPEGEYAQSVLGRERVFEHFSRTMGIPVAIIRLYYATEMRYGVLVDIAQKVWNYDSVSVDMSNLNAIWQGDANAMSLQSFDHVSSPPFVVNVVGPEILSIRRVAEQFGEMMGRPLDIEGSECDDALLGNGQLSHRLFGYPRVSTQEMMHWIARWVMSGGASLGKPTHFETRDGKY